MKKTILIAASLLLAGFVQAQDNKMWLSGTVGLQSYSDDDDNKTFGGVFSPGFGYSINPKIAVGIGLTYSSFTDEEEVGNDTYEFKTTEFSVAPFFRYYKSLADKCALYGELNVAFGSGKEEDDNGPLPDTEDTYGFFQAKIAPGIQYWVHDNWSINAEWGVLSYRVDNDKADTDLEEDWQSNELNVGLDMAAITFGVNFHF